MIVSNNNSTTTYYVNRVRRNKIRFVFLDPFIEFHILSFCVMKLKTRKIHKLVNKVEIRICKMNPDGGSLVVIVFFEKMRDIILKGSVLDNLFRSDVNCFVGISPEVNVLLDIGKLAEESFIEDSFKHPKLLRL